MRIRVTQQDIDEGVQNNCFHCPVARAIKREFKAAEVWVREIIIVKKPRSQRQAEQEARVKARGKRICR